MFKKIKEFFNNIISDLLRFMVETTAHVEVTNPHYPANIEVKVVLFKKFHVDSAFSFIRLNNLYQIDVAKVTEKAEKLKTEEANLPLMIDIVGVEATREFVDMRKQILLEEGKEDKLNTHFVIDTGDTMRTIEDNYNNY